MTENLKKIDWILILSVIPLLMAGLFTMKTFGTTQEAGTAGDYFFWHQLIWIGLGLAVFFAVSFSDLRWLRHSLILVLIYLATNVLLLAVLFLAGEIRGTASWFSVGLFSLEPSEPAKIALILVLAKYFSRRHIEIANIKHIIVSGLYAILPMAFVFLQPDFGSAVVLGVLWFGMVMASGISKKHLLILLAGSIVVSAVFWFFLLAPYQRTRISAFLNPYIDPRGAGYQVIQAKIAVGSGGVFGRGIGFGSQSRLEFLPEHQTDFIFAAFAEEWGFLGALLLITFFILVVRRISRIGLSSGDNFTRLYSVGVTILIATQFAIHVGMNIGLLPITGLTLPFVSYGGSSLITFFASLGILMSFKIKSSFLARKTADVYPHLSGT